MAGLLLMGGSLLLYLSPWTRAPITAGSFQLCPFVSVQAQKPRACMLPFYDSLLRNLEHALDKTHKNEF
jgi:hypothetical protein